MPVRIPDQHKPTIARLAALPEATVNKIDKALRNAQPAISPAALSRQIAASVDVARLDLTSLITVLLSLTITRRVSKTSIAQIAHDIVDAAAREGLGDLKPDTPAAKALEGRLIRLLSAGPSLEITGRAADVYFAHDTLFHTARVLSDVRPIFSLGELTKPAAGMVVHNLELTVHKEKATQHEFIAMNIHDLRELRRVIARAIKKDSILRELIKGCAMTYVEDVPNEHQR